MSSNCFWDLERFSSNVALIDAGEQVRYARLAHEAKRFAERFGPDRSLVFLEARNSLPSIAAYLGCLMGKHPVHLFGEQDADRLEHLLGTYRPAHVLRWRNGSEDLTSFGDTARHLHPELRVLLSTSGSTGSPKFVKLSAANIQSNASSIAEYLQLGPTERAMTGLKFNYSYGMSVVNSHLASGATLVLTEQSATERGFWDLFAQTGATSFAGVPHTFEVLQRVTFPWAETPGLRYVTQAGGRLAPDLVTRFAALGRKHGWRFYVMYGQTEAAPRISYLPPELAAQFPQSIGIPIPGGALEVLDENGDLIKTADQPGELTYRGPNVMMGYALSAPDLARDETPERLRTGDLACRNEQGLFYIVGRMARFVKPFGIRVNLDEMQQQLGERAPGAVCAGTDERIVAAIPRSEGGFEPDEIVAKLADRYQLPPFIFSVVAIDEIPLLDNGKIDYPRILAFTAEDRPQTREHKSEGVSGQTSHLASF